jgi:DNA-binding MurR/RpiR family transcriptional regulator
VLENPNEVGVSTVREIAEAAKVKPNTVVRMARQVGFEGYEDFRAPFREAIRQGAVSFPDRARWLQDVRANRAISAGFMPTWSKRRSATSRRPSPASTPKR